MFASASESTSGRLSSPEPEAVSPAMTEKAAESAEQAAPVPVFSRPASREKSGDKMAVHLGNKLFAMPLPQNLTPTQRQIALELMREAEPRLSVMHEQLRATLEELHNLSFASDTPPDALANLGKKLVRLRNDILLEMRQLSLKMKERAGFNPGWGTRKCHYTPEESIPPCERFE